MRASITATWSVDEASVTDQGFEASFARANWKVELASSAFIGRRKGKAFGVRVSGCDRLLVNAITLKLVSAGVRLVNTHFYEPKSEHDSAE